MKEIPQFEDLESRLLLDGSPLIGDANLDDRVDIQDLQVIVANIGEQNATWNQGDFDSNGFVDALDYISLKQNFGQSREIEILEVNNVLNIIGTKRDDEITVSQNVSGTTINNLFFAEDYNSIFISSGSGDDIININYSVSDHVDILAGNGNDIIYNNGQGASIINGESGNDTIVSIGGGVDSVEGSTGTDFIWVDSSDTIVDIAADPNGCINIISDYFIVSGWSPISLDSAGQDLRDPTGGENWADNSNIPLFTNGPDLEDIDQGELGDCYLMGVLSAIANTHPEVIHQTITSLGDGTHIVRYLENGDLENPVYIRVDSDMPGNFAAITPDNELWVRVYEKAMAIFKYGDANASYESMRISRPAAIMREISGVGTSYIPINYSIIKLFNIIQSNINVGNAMTLWTRSFPPDDPFTEDHTYTIVDSAYTEQGSYLLLRNPRAWDGVADWDDNPLDALIFVPVNSVWLNCIELAVMA